MIYSCKQDIPSHVDWWDVLITNINHVEGGISC
jgi:hypothetical protein